MGLKFYRSQEIPVDRARRERKGGGGGGAKGCGRPKLKGYIPQNVRIDLSPNLQCTGTIIKMSFQL